MQFLKSGLVLWFTSVEFLKKQLVQKVFLKNTFFAAQQTKLFIIPKDRSRKVCKPLIQQQFNDTVFKIRLF